VLFKSDSKGQKHWERVCRGGRARTRTRKSKLHDKKRRISPSSKRGELTCPFQGQEANPKNHKLPPPSLEKRKETGVRGRTTDGDEVGSRSLLCARKTGLEAHHGGGRKRSVEREHTQERPVRAKSKFKQGEEREYIFKSQPGKRAWGKGRSNPGGNLIERPGKWNPIM